MKNFIIALVFTLASVCSFISCTSQGESAKPSQEQLMLDSIEAQHKLDSIQRELFVKDSLAKEDSVFVATHKSLFKETKDEFSNYTWIEPKNTPACNANYAYCYIAMDGDTPSSLRLKYQYRADDWLFIRSMTFNIDGENFNYIPNDMERDNAYGTIWEFFDERVSGDLATIVTKIAEAKSVKLKLHGSQYYATRTLSASQIQLIKDTYNYYLALGGKL